MPSRIGDRRTHDGLEPADRFYYADELDLSWMPTLNAIWGPKGRHVLIETPAQPKKRYGIGAVNYHTGETVVLIRWRKRRREIAELLEALLEKHPSGNQSKYDGTSIIKAGSRSGPWNAAQAS